jgi:glycosyltransferase involved in cell wall biosynthesis
METTGDPVRVTFVSSHARRGGSERYLADLVATLGSDWVYRIVSLQSGPLVDQLRAAGHAPEVLATSGRPAGLVATAIRLRRALARSGTQVVHANGIKAALVSVVATGGLGTPVVWVKHDFSWDGPLARAVARGCTTIVCVSGAVAATFHGAARRKVRVIHTGLPSIEVDRVGGRAKLAPHGSAPAGPIVGLVGSFHPVKGHMDFLDAFRSVRQAVPEARAVFVGGVDPSVPEQEGRVRARVAELGLEPFVSFLGHRDDAIDLIAGLDVVVIPSQAGTEGLPLVSLEAQSVGTPVVAHAVGGLPEALGACGPLVPPGDVRALAGGILQVIGDVHLRERLVACGQRRMRERFSRAGMVDRMMACYVDAAARSRIRRRDVSRART